MIELEGWLHIWMCEWLDQMDIVYGLMSDGLSESVYCEFVWITENALWCIGCLYIVNMMCFFYAYSLIESCIPL